MGIIYGDIGTSPLYVYASTFTANPAQDDVVVRQEPKSNPVLCILLECQQRACVMTVFHATLQQAAVPVCRRQRRLYLAWCKQKAHGEFSCGLMWMPLSQGLASLIFWTLTLVVVVK